MNGHVSSHGDASLVVFRALLFTEQQGHLSTVSSAACASVCVSAGDNRCGGRACEQTLRSGNRDKNTHCFPTCARMLLVSISCLNLAPKRPGQNTEPVVAVAYTITAAGSGDQNRECCGSHACICTQVSSIVDAISSAADTGSGENRKWSMV